MNSHQIAPRDSSSAARRPSEPAAMHRINQRPRALPKRKSMTDAPQSSASRLSELLKKMTRSSSTSHHEIDEHDDDDVDADVRASWPSIRIDQQKESFGSRAQHAIFNAWTSLHRSSSSPLFTPPQFLLRTRRRISQSFNLKVVQAVGKDMRRSESEWRNSFSDSRSSHGSTVSSWDEDTEPESLNLSERLSLTVGRHVSRDFAPMLTEGSPLECRVREIVYALLRNPKTLEGHTCHNFFVQQESFTSTRAVACRHYLKRTRDTISDVIQFIVEYRLRDLREELLVLCCEPNDDAATPEIRDAVRRAVEEYFCFSLRYELRQWSIGSSEVDHRSRFKKTLAKWSTMDPSSPEFGLQSYGENPLIDQAIAMLQEIDSLATPSRKMRRFLVACEKLSEVIAPSADTASLEPPSPTSRVCLGAADAFLPLMIFAVSRSKLTDPLVECAMLYGLFPFESEFGEEMYYLTMFEAALEFIRTHS